MNDKVKINSTKNILNKRLQQKYHVDYEGDIIKKYIKTYNKYKGDNYVQM